MFNKEILRDVIDNYKKGFKDFQWPKENYKWKAVKTFQDNWDIEASNFHEMLTNSLSNAGNLLESRNNFPGLMMKHYAKQAPEDVRKMFSDLFDESNDLYKRIENFKLQARVINDKVDDPEKQHYQNENSISVYLWLRYPDKYYIFKYGEIKEVSKTLESDYLIKRAAYEDNINNSFAFYNEICEEISKDNDLISIFKNELTDDCYDDPKFKTLTIDVGFYTSRYYGKELGVENSIEKSQRDSKGSALADDDVDTIHYWIYSPGDNASNWEEYYAKGIMAIGWSELGDLSDYEKSSDIRKTLELEYGEKGSYKNDTKATWQFANEMKIGDIVFAKKGMHTIVGRGQVISDYIFDESQSFDNQNIRQIDWTHKGEWEHPGNAVTKTLTDITSYTNYVKKLNGIFDGEYYDDDNFEDIEYPLYEKSKFLEEVYMDEKNYDILVNLLRKKKNIVLQGPPGVGKTFAAKRLAYSMIGEKNQDRVMMIQFHQSYSYEDFIEGFRPSSNGMSFDIKKGAFYNFCKEASDDSDNEYFFIIDEINRGNLSKIFGELFVLMENDKRGNDLHLLYSDELFNIPENVYIIGMMNTADRSLAMMDYALRRRFAFYEMQPGFDTIGFKNYRENIQNDKFKNLINTVIQLNNDITLDDSLGEGFCIGHSYFCDLYNGDYQELSNIVEFELIPLLKEYWFDEKQKIKDWSQKLRSSIL